MLRNVKFKHKIIFWKEPCQRTAVIRPSPDSAVHINVIDINWSIFTKLGVNIMPLDISLLWYVYSSLPVPAWMSCKHMRWEQRKHHSAQVL